MGDIEKISIFWISFGYHIDMISNFFGYHLDITIVNYIDMISKIISIWYPKNIEKISENIGYFFDIFARYRFFDIRYRWYRFQKYRKNIHFFRYFLDIISISKNRYHTRYRFQKYRKNILLCPYHLDIISIFRYRYHPSYRPRKYPRNIDIFKNWTSLNQLLGKC